MGYASGHLIETDLGDGDGWLHPTRGHGDTAPMLLRGNDVVTTIKGLKPPFDAETERELIAVAFAHSDAKARTAAGKLVDANVRDAKVIKSTLGSGFRNRHSGDACEKLRRLARKDRGQLAVALAAQGASVLGVAFEEDEEFAREHVFGLLRKKENVLYLTEREGKNCVYSYELQTIPDVVFDELPALRKKQAFDNIVLWGTAMTDLPDRFVEFAPFLKRLTLGFLDFTKLPDVVCELVNLEELHIHAQELVALNPKLKKLRKLKKLTLGHTKKLKALPPEVCELPALEVLDVAFAPYRSLPKELGNLTSLVELDLQSSQIGKLPDEIVKCTKLKKIVTRWSKVKPEKVKALLPKVQVEN